MTELHSNDAGYTHLTSGLLRHLKKLVDGLVQRNRVQYLSKGLDLLVILKNIHKDYNQQNATHPCAYGVAVRGFGDILSLRNRFPSLTQWDLDDPLAISLDCDNNQIKTEP